MLPELPFFDEGHRAFATGLDRWLATANVLDDERNADASCRAWARALAENGWLRACVPGAFGGLRAELDVRTICLARETLAYRSALADFAFAMQGLGSGAITLAGSRSALWVRSTVGYSIWRAGRAWSGSSIFQEKASSERESKFTV